MAPFRGVHPGPRAGAARGGLQFLIAFLIPGLLVNLFGETANQALIPTLVRVREAGGKAQAQRLLESVQTAMVGLLVAGVGVVGLSGRWMLTGDRKSVV